MTILDYLKKDAFMAEEFDLISELNKLREFKKDADDLISVLKKSVKTSLELIDIQKQMIQKLENDLEEAKKNPFNF